MNLSLQAMLQLSIILPILAALLIVVTGRKPNLRESATLTTCIILIYFTINLYLGVKQGETISVTWWQLLPGLE